MLALRCIPAMLALTVVCAGCTSPARRPADLTQVGVVEAAQLIRSQKVTSAELTAAYIERADANPHLNAYITLDRTGAMAAARQADAELAAGKVKGPLHGVPLVVKDNIHVAGMPNSAGTPALRGFVPKDSALVVRKLVDAGALVLGKTNMHELAFGISGYNEATFTAQPIGVRNPYDLTRFAGGSSSGTGAAIAARMAPGGLGSDTGGSSRIPSAVTGGAGFRPTIGRYSQDGVTPISHTRDTVGPMARTVSDVALLDAVITGGKPVAPVSLKGVRLGVYRAYFFNNLDADTKAVADAALEKLTKAGATIVEVDMPDLQRLNNAASFPVALYEAYEDLDAYLAKYGTGKTVEEVAALIVSKDVKTTYDALVLPRKLPGPGWSYRCRAGVRSGDQGSAPGADQALCGHVPPVPDRCADLPDQSRTSQRSRDPKRAVCRPSCCSSRTPIRAATLEYPACPSRRDSAQRPDCQWASRSTVRAATTNGCSPSGWGSRTRSGRRLDRSRNATSVAVVCSPCLCRRFPLRLTDRSVKDWGVGTGRFLGKQASA